MIHATSHQTVRRLTYFAAVAQAGSIRGGAEVLGLSVPVVSAALSELEEELGVTLAARTTRSFRLTPVGQEVHAATQDMMRAADKVGEVAGKTPEAPLQGTLSISVTTEMATHWLPDRLARFMANHPDLRLHVDARDDVVPLNMSRFDLAIRMNGPMTRKDARGQSFVDLCCVVPPGTLGRPSGSGWVFDVPLLTPSDGAPELFGHAKSDGSPVRLEFASAMTVTNREAARRMAASGLGAALVLADAAARDQARGEVDFAVPDVDFGVVCHRVMMRDALPSAAARAFAHFLAED
jgi:DNA-binding transcriptional LysR family regulator